MRYYHTIFKYHSYKVLILKKIYRHNTFHYYYKIKKITFLINKKINFTISLANFLIFTSLRQHKHTMYHPTPYLHLSPLIYFFNLHEIISKIVIFYLSNTIK